MADLRKLPSVDKLLSSPTGLEWISEYGRALALEAVRQTLEHIRQECRGEPGLPSESEINSQVHSLLESFTRSTLLPVINASGVILHTNLGRAPLSQAARQAVEEIAGGYVNLEYDLEKGRRGSRLFHAQSYLTHLSGAEAALVVNNNAAAVLLALSGLARRRGVVISRTQLVEIGGGFRVPDVMKQSGARLVEIGTTNRVHLADYERSLEEKPALFLRAHRSNFKIMGFTSEPSLEEVVQVAHQAGIPLVDDLGSGSFLDTAAYGLEHEPTVQESILAGADLVCFSGDKLLGGPQAGIIVGKEALIAKLRRHPLARAIRADKMEIAALGATLVHYLRGEAIEQVPVWRMIAADAGGLHQRARAWAQTLADHGLDASVVASESMVGGGSLPGETLPTSVLVLTVRNATRFTWRLRHARIPIVARVEDQQVALDPRTVLPEQDSALLAGILEASK